MKKLIILTSAALTFFLGIHFAGDYFNKEYIRLKEILAESKQTLRNLELERGRLEEHLAALKMANTLGMRALKHATVIYERNDSEHVIVAHNYISEYSRLERHVKQSANAGNDDLLWQKVEPVDYCALKKALNDLNKAVNTLTFSVEITPALHKLKEAEYCPT